MPLDPRIPLMGNIYQPDFGEIAQNRAQSMNVLSQMRQRDQELAQQNQFAEYVKGGGLKNNPLGALQFNEAGQQALSALTNYEQMKAAQDKAAREAEEATQKRRAEGRARSAWFFLNSDGTPEDLEQANAVARQFDIDDDEIAQTNSWIASQKDPKQALKGLALTDENVRKAMEAVAPKIEKVDAGDKWIFRDVSPMSPTFNQDLGTIGKDASPDAIIAATTAANAQANQLVIAQMQQAAKTPTGNEGLDTVLTSLRNTIDNLVKKGAMVDTSRFGSIMGVGQNIFASLRASPAGQVAERSVGTPESAERDVFKSDRLRLTQAVKNVLGMSTKQLDSNVELKTWLDSVGSPEFSKQANEQILQNIENFVSESLREQGKSPTGAGAGAGAGTGRPADIEDLLNEYAPQK